MTMTHTQLLATLEQTVPILQRLTVDLGEEALNFRTGKDEWSIREILAHLVENERFIMIARVARMVKEEHPTLVPHDEKRWHSQRNTSRDTLNELLHDLAVQRAASLNTLAFLSEHDWSRTAYHPESGELTVQTWVEHWAEHDLAHIQQIEGILAVFAKN
jgi:hypothetical protein